MPQTQDRCRQAQPGGARPITEVQNVVQFSTEYNMRLTVLTTGHDQLARSDAGSGLLIDLSLLDGVRVLESFTATEKRQVLVDPNTEVNVIQPKEGVQAAVMFGPARAGLPLNYALGESGLFSFANYRELFDTTNGPLQAEPAPPTYRRNRGVVPFDSRLLAAEQLTGTTGRHG
ncbi:hypothetical protein INS49_004392 [Diaporthe citri]|uniref:uncharacterized protein n=1 Tax=Diaporthe citri TaxID=83186 RepID=UPI001C8061E7|nr:uncharacterized protein INS49_004392 [Diaporthe citri]KAG6354375.1 hypothetical protein INS49_004392 [Diaporthe citri]